MLPSENVPVAVNCWVLPRAIEGFGGETVSETNELRPTLRTAEPTITPELAVIAVAPFATPVASPLLLTVAMLRFAEAQVAEVVRLLVLPSVKVPVAVNG
jgi:hypothetical protein